MGIDAGQATLGHPLVHIAFDPAGEKGNIAVVTRDISAGVTLVVEQPTLVTKRPAPTESVRLEALATDFKTDCSSDVEKLLVPMLFLRWFPVLLSYEGASAEIRQKISQLQTRFAEPECVIAMAVSQLSRQLHVRGLLHRLGASHSDHPQGGAAFTEDKISALIASMVLNNINTMPDGSEVVFDLGLRFEHSCAPNSKFHLHLSEKAHPSRGVGHLPAGTWIGEWRAIYPISKGEPATVSYLNDEWLAKDGKSRRELLLLRMGFLCCCTRCKQELDPVDRAAECDVPQLWSDLSEMD